MSELDEYLAFAESLCDGAGEVARHYFNQRNAYDVETKSDNSPVTIADKEIEMQMVQRIRSTYPTHGIIGEETGNHQVDAEYVWVIDPIDGTRAFIAGRATFVTLLALCKHGLPVLGVIDQPVKRSRWAAHTERNTTFNGAPVTSNHTHHLKDAMISTTSIPYFGAVHMMAFQALESATRSTLLNHDGYAYGLIANGGLDIVVDVGLKPFDFCALIPVIEMAGGKVTDWSGQPVTMQSDGTIIACACETLYDKAFSLINSR